MSKFDELYESLINEKVKIVTPYDKDYQDLIKQVKKLPWDSKPTMFRGNPQSVEGTINGTKVAFTYSTPDINYGFWYSFQSLLVRPPSADRFEEKFKESWKELYNAVIPLVDGPPIKGLQWVRQGMPGLDKKLVDANLKDFKDAIDYARGL